MCKKRLTFVQWGYKIIMNILGLFMCGVAIVLAVQSGLGASPWDVLSLGITNYIPITLGQASQIVAFILLIFTWSKGVIPGVGTILNAYFIGFFIDLTFKFGIKTPDQLSIKILMLLGSLIIFALGIVLSLRAKIGVGTRDALMEYLITSTKKPVNLIRACLEIGALAIGILLKGPFGIGTIVLALTLGYFIKFAAKILNYDFDAFAHYTLKDSYLNLKNKKTDCTISK